MVITSTVTIGNLIVYTGRISPTMMSYEDYKWHRGEMSGIAELEQVERTWFSILLCDEIKENQFEDYVEKQMNYLYQVWYEADGAIIYNGIEKTYEHTNDKNYDIYTLKTVEYDNSEQTEFDKKTFLKLNKRLEADVRYCLEKNLESWKKMNEDLQADYPAVTKKIVEKDNRKEWRKYQEQIKNYPVYRMYEQYRDMDQRGSVIHNCINIGEYARGGIGLELDLRDEYERKLTMWLNETFEGIFKKNNFALTITPIEYQKMEERVEEGYKQYQKFYQDLVMMVLLCVASATLLIIIRWKETDTDKKTMNNWSKIGTEVQACLLLASFLSSIVFIGYCRDQYLAYGFVREFWKIFFCGYIALATIVVGNCILSQVELLKQRQWLKGFLSLRFTGKWLKDIYSYQSFRIKVLILVFVLPLLCIFRIFIPIVILFLMYVTSRFLKEFSQIERGVTCLKNGELNYKIEIEREGTLKNIADNINTISDGLQLSIQREVQAERMKTELISNVSHDIKTPLTSIITYIDLLKQENIENEVAKDYILVLEQKANRLKVLTDDLFEAAKATSGDMPVHLESVHVQSLVQQTLGEYGEKLSEKGFMLRVQMREEPLYIRADGKLMWRVLSNLLSNVMKYSVPYSRVYLDIEEENENVNICIKNISEQELNISADELMERFVRGDESRGTEGSGLGLNIANSLVQLQNGNFKIEIDGDLFKVLVQLPKDSNQLLY